MFSLGEPRQTFRNRRKLAAQFDLTSFDCLTIYLIQKESRQNRVNPTLPEVFGIDIVHTVEFSKIGCCYSFSLENPQSNFTNLPKNFCLSKPDTQKFLEVGNSQISTKTKAFRAVASFTLVCCFVALEPAT